MPKAKKARRLRQKDGQTSVKRLYASAQAVRKAYDKKWNDCSKDEIELLPSGQTQSTKRRRKLIPTRVIGPICSSVGAHLYSEFAQKAASCGVDSVKPESRSNPFLPSLSKGAVAMLESFLCAYTQEAVADAWYLCDSATNTKRLNENFLKAGLENAKGRLFPGAQNYNVLEIQGTALV